MCTQLQCLGDARCLALLCTVRDVRSDRSDPHELAYGPAIRFMISDIQIFCLIMIQWFARLLAYTRRWDTAIRIRNAQFLEDICYLLNNHL